MNLFVRNTPAAAWCRCRRSPGHWIVGPVQLVRYNGYPDPHLR
ncbi:hypothetical protein [Ralstonia solanacearum]|nr:hypothetical protein [Ralstonia solanacearum]